MAGLDSSGKFSGTEALHSPGCAGEPSFAALTGTGAGAHSVPAVTEAPVVVTTSNIEAELAQTINRLGFPPGLLESLTGISGRRFWERGTQPSDAAVDSAERLLAECGVDRSSIGLIVNLVLAPPPSAPCGLPYWHGTGDAPKGPS